MGILFYSTRIVLNALGASDFGIFNLMAGVIGMLSFLNASMTVSTQRYLSYYQGTGDFEMQKKVFSNSWLLHILLGLLIVVLLVGVSPLLFHGFLNIPSDRISTAKAIYYFISASVFFTIISTPFTALLTAHENMLFIAIVNIFESVFKLAVAFSLHYFIANNRLFIYGILMALLSTITFIMYAWFSLKKYKESSILIHNGDKRLIKELGVYTGWNLFGNFARLGRAQGIAVLLNIFFGTVVNAAYGIANQVSGQFNFLSATLVRVLNPQIMKSEGMNDRERVLRLSMSACKMGFTLLAIIAIPCIFEMPTLLKLWLKTPPDNTATFCSLFLGLLLVEQLTIGLLSAIQAVGQMKVYQVLIGGLWLFNIPLAYVLLKVNFLSPSVLISAIAIEVLATFIRIYLAKKIAGMSPMYYVEKVLLKLVGPIVVTTLVCYVITTYMSSHIRFIITVMASITSFFTLIYLTGLEREEKQLVNNMIKKAFGKVYKNNRLTYLKDNNK